MSREGYGKNRKRPNRTHHGSSRGRAWDEIMKTWPDLGLANVDHTGTPPVRLTRGERQRKKGKGDAVT